MLNTLQYYYSLLLIISLFIFWKTHISCCPYLFTSLSSFLLHNLIHTYYTITYNTPQLFQTPLSFSLTLKFYCFAAQKHISILFYTYPTASISKYLNTSPYSSLTKSFLLENNLYNFFSDYNLIVLLSLISISLILPYIIHITNTIFHKTSISFTISILLKRYQTLILKTLLMESINFYY